MKTGQAGLDIIKKFEGCRLEPYKLTGEKYYTIGYGHYGPDVKPGEMITLARAEELLRADLAKFEGYVERYATIPLTQNRFDALVSYTYNRGPGGMRQLAEKCHTIEEYSEGLVKYWGSATRYKNALIKRRKAEKALFDKDAEKAGQEGTAASNNPGQTQTSSITEIAREVINGKWGNGMARRAALTEAGYNYAMVQAEVNRIIGK